MKWYVVISIGTINVYSDPFTDVSQAEGVANQLRIYFKTKKVNIIGQYEETEPLNHYSPNN